MRNTTDPGLYCKVFLDTPRKRQFVSELVATIVSGSRERCEISSAELDISVNDNDDRDPTRSKSSEDGFLYYPYFLDVDPVPSCDRARYVESVRNLLNELRERGMRPVAACDFENEL